MTYGELRTRMSAKEFTEWSAFYSYERKVQDEANRKQQQRR